MNLHPNLNMVDFQQINPIEPNREILINQSDSSFSDIESLVYSSPPDSMLRDREAIRRLPFWRRFFRLLGSGSLRKAALISMSFSLDVGACLAPFCMSCWGLLPGTLLFVCAAAVTYFSLLFFLEAQNLCLDTRPAEVVKKFLPPCMYWAFRCSLLLELFATPALLVSLSYKLFCFVLFVNGRLEDDWIRDIFSLRLYEFEPSLFIVRIFYIHFAFILLIILLLKTNIDKFGFICLIQISAACFMALTVLVYARSDFLKTHHASSQAQTTRAEWIEYPLRPLWIRNLFITLLIFYPHSQMARIRNQVLVPSFSRLKKVCRISIGSQWTVYTLVGLGGYLLWGNLYTPVLLFLRQQLHTPWLFQAAVCFLIVSLLVKVTVFNVGLRDTLIKLNLRFSSFD